MIDYQKCFIDNLKYYRKQKGISQSQLAEACDVSNGTIGNIECGITKPSFDLILLIADRLGIKPELLFYSDKHAQFDSEIINTSFSKQQINKIKKTLNVAVNNALKNLETSK
ncbi:MAG: helix-turn-helix domain-containing protein [Treponema sp.]